MDVFYCPSENERDRLCDTTDFWIPPHESRVLPTGLKVEIPKGFMLEIKNKSGIASKRQLLVGACVIDPGYDGEVLINLHNLGTGSQVIKPGEKIAQAILIPIVHCGVEERYGDADCLNLGSKRGSGGFGSTGDM
jgi:dUTP pyrophosphatase